MVAEYVTSLKAAWEVAKALKTATDAIDDAQIKLQIADLISALADAKIEAAESVEKIAELERRLNSQSTFKYDGSKYYQELESGERDGPYCPTCFDLNKNEIRLQGPADWIAGNWNCEVCNGYFN